MAKTKNVPPKRRHDQSPDHADGPTTNKMSRNTLSGSNILKIVPPKRQHDQSLDHDDGPTTNKMSRNAPSGSNILKIILPKRRHDQSPDRDDGPTINKMSRNAPGRSNMILEELRLSEDSSSSDEEFQTVESSTPTGNNSSEDEFQTVESSKPKVNKLKLSKPTRKRTLYHGSEKENEPPVKKQVKKKGLNILNLPDRKYLCEKALNISHTRGIDTKDLQPLDKNDKSRFFKLKFVKNDCYSLYRSISYLIFGNERYHSIIKDVVTKTMLDSKNNDVLDKFCNEHTEYHTVDCFIRETKMNETTNMSNSFVVLKALAIALGVPVHLFIDPVHVSPMLFSPRTKAIKDSQIILYRDLGYFAPVLEFDGERFHHDMYCSNEDLITLTNGNHSITISVSKLNIVSTDLCQAAVRQGNQLKIRISSQALENIDSFSGYQHNVISLDPDLVNLCGRFDCPGLLENQIDKLRKSSDLQAQVTFLDGFDKDGMGFFDRFKYHFEDACHQSSLEELKGLCPKNENVRDIVSRVLDKRSNYLLTTERVNVMSDDNELLFTDVYPYTVLCLNISDKTIKYFSGPKPNQERWIDFKVNRRFQKILDSTKNSDHILFDGVTLYVYICEETSGCQIGCIENVFDHKGQLNFYNLPPHRKKLKSIKITKSDKDEVLLVDTVSKQVLDLKKRKWWKSPSIITIHEVKNYTTYVMTEAESDKKHHVILRDSTSKTLYAFANLINRNVFFPCKIVCMVLISNAISEFRVRTRLADQNITLNPEKRWEESNMLLYGEKSVILDYIIPQNESPNCIYTLMSTECINKFLLKK